MDLKKLPPSLLVALGLGCGPSVPDDEAGDGSPTSADAGPTTTACLIAPETVGPCLDGNFTSTGPCLEPPGDTGSDTGFNTEAGTGTSGTDTGTSTAGSSSSGSDTGTFATETATSVCLGGIAPDAPDARLDGQQGVRERLIEAGVLPNDVAERLKR